MLGIILAITLNLSSIHNVRACIFTDNPKITVMENSNRDFLRLRHKKKYEEKHIDDKMIIDDIPNIDKNFVIEIDASNIDRGMIIEY